MRRFFKSFIYALHGIGISTREQRNLKVQAFVGLFTVGAALYFDVTATEWCLILIAIGMVIGMEMMNSAVESLVDLVTEEFKPLAGKVKDIAAGSVLFVSILAVIIGLIIFKKYVLPG
jgi:diacylglycerol kinase